MNLLMALFWLLLGVALMAYEMTTQDKRIPHIRGTNISVTWLLLVLVLYNLSRWWLVRNYQAEQRAVRIAEIERQRELALRERRESYANPDPNLDFTSKPPAAPNRNITDQPPSNN